MSWEAWGDDDAGQYDPLIDAGWWSSEQADEVTAAIKALMAEPVYEDGKLERGISRRFLARMWLLEVAAGMRASSDPFAVEARALTEDGQ